MTQARDALVSKLDSLRAERQTVEDRLALNGLRADPRLDRQRLRRLNLEVASLEGTLAELDQLSLVGDAHPRETAYDRTADEDALYDDAA